MPLALVVPPIPTLVLLLGSKRLEFTTRTVGLDNPLIVIFNLRRAPHMLVRVIRIVHPIPNGGVRLTPRNKRRCS